MQNLFHIDKGENFPQRVRTVVEVPAGSRTKYEYDIHQGIFRLDRILKTSARYPGNYGFVPQTLGNTVNPVDVFILLHDPLFPGCVVEVRPIGLLEMADELGVDSKLLAVPVKDPRMEDVTNLSQVKKAVLSEIQHFFETYKRITNVKGWLDKEEAYRFLEEAHREYLRRYRRVTKDGN